MYLLKKFFFKLGDNYILVSREEKEQLRAIHKWQNARA